eukprot:g1798.t1
MQDGSDVYSLTVKDWSSDLESEVFRVLLNFTGCWIRILKTIDTKPRSFVISNVTLQMGNFLNHAQFIAHYKVGDLSVRLNGKQFEVCITGEYFLQFWSHEVEDFVVIDLNQKWVSVFLTLRHPPRLSRQCKANSRVDDRVRVSEVFVEGQTRLNSNSFFRCKTYQLIFGHWTYRSIAEQLECLKKEVYYSKISISKASADDGEMQELNMLPKCQHSASWDVNLAWFCVMSSPGFVPERFTPSFFKKLDSWNERVVVRGLFWLAQMMNKDHFLNPNDHLEYFPKACAIRRQNQNLENSTSNCRIPRLILTPTRLVFFEPEIINSNRILRNWSDKTSFLKVSVRDENLEKLSRHTGSIKELLESLFHQMKTGFDLPGGKQFRFLGCSNNQVRDHGCFFVDISSNSRMAEEIRRNCGNLHYIRNVAKYISRLGQAFSTSIQTINIEPDECEHIADIKDNGYTFTDGIGKISPGLACKIAAKLEHCSGVPCAFQVRFGGCKGVLAVDMGMKDHPYGRHLAFRDSMIKYWSNDTSIEVLASYARPQELCLNQQLIMLLSNLGISDDVFMKLMKDQLKLMSNMFINEQTARERLSSMDCGINWRLLFKTDFRTTSDPYFRSLLSALYKGRIKGLREKSRIPIDPLKARVLLGTVDETRTLQYGQVFIQISKQLNQPGNEKLIIQQRVVIGKSPCLHPGDVRTFNAIDCPLLYHMCDCVVFPSQGPRPHPNELSGSDLDGDLYHVIWLEELVPCVENKVSMNYPSIPVVETQDAVSTDDMLDFLQENIEFDCLGQINNMHKALVDQKGLESDCCLHLAELHTQAVDAPKTGQWPKIQSKFRKLLNKYPDFMMKEDKPSYPSEKVLGRMYRECTTLCNNENLSINWKIPKIIQINGFEKFIEDAKKHKNDYNSALLEIMEMYGVQTEAEIMSGCVQSYHKKIGKEGTAISDIIYSIKSRLIEKYRGIFIEDLELLDSKSIDEDQAICKAAAWYNVCYSHEGNNKSLLRREQSKKFLSFAWVNAEYLIKAFIKANYQSPPIQMQIELDIDQSWLQERSRLIPIYQDLVSAKDEINSLLMYHGFQGMLCGTSNTMLFDKTEPELELLVSCDDNDDPSLLFIGDLMHSLRTIFQDNEIDCSIISDSNGIEKLQFDFHSKTLSKIIKGCITVDRSMQQLQSRILLEYIFNSNWLLIVFRILLKWLRVEEMLDRNKITLIHGQLICFCFIDYCLTKNYIQPVSPCQVDVDDLEASSDLDIWRLIINGMDKIKRPELGTLFLEFLSEFIPNQIHPELQCVLNKMQYSRYSSAESIELLKETLYRGYHKLSFHCSISSLFSAMETEKVIYLQQGTINRLNGTVQYLEQLIFRTTGVHVSSHRRNRDGAGVLMSLTGKHVAIYSAEKVLRDFERRNDALIKQGLKYPGNLELLSPDHKRVIIENVTNKNRRIRFVEYWGPHHPDDDNSGLYLLKTKIPSLPMAAGLYNCQHEKFLCFKDFFLSKWSYLTNQYDSEVHGPIKLRVQFGQFYIVGPSKVLLEQSCGIDIHQLSELLVDDNQNKIPDVKNWKQFLRNKPKRRKQNRSRWNTSGKSAFFNRIHSSISGSMLRQMINNLDVSQVDKRSYFCLHLKGYKHGIEAIYEANDLKLSSVRYPPLKWMTVDVKRHQDSELVHDIRFDLASQDTAGAEINKSELVRALFRKPGESSYSVIPSLMPKVITFDQVSVTEFQFNSSDPFGQHTRLILCHVSSKSRAHEMKDRFQIHEEGHQLYFEVDLEAFGLDLKSDDFITELWYQSLCLSDRLKQQQQQQQQQQIQSFE